MDGDGEQMLSCSIVDDVYGIAALFTNCTKLDPIIIELTHAQLDVFCTEHLGRHFTGGLIGAARDPAVASDQKAFSH